MAKLLEAWLNSEVELSKKVSNFEEDFANGFLLGELLFKFNQQEDFGEFSDKSTRQHILSNFSRMVASFRLLGIKLDHRTIDGIIKGAPGVALSLVFRLKMALENTAPPIDFARTGMIAELTPSKVIRPVRPSYDALEARQFQRRIRSMHIPEKETIMENRLAKFEEFRIANESRMKQEKERLRALSVRDREDNRHLLMGKIKRNAAFKEEWEHKGLVDWKKNVETRMMARNAELSFKLRQYTRLKDRTDRVVHTSLNDVYNGISLFENTLIDHGVPVKPYKDTPLTERKEKPNVKRIDNKRRNMRKGFMISKIFEEEQLKITESRINGAVTKLNVVSEFETKKEKDIENVKSLLDLFLNNRKLKNTQVAKKTEHENELIAKRHNFLQSQIDRSNAQNTQINSEKCKKLKISDSVFKRNDLSEEIGQIVHLIVDIFENKQEYSQYADTYETDPRIWEEWIENFKNGVRPRSENEESLNQKAMESYIHSTGQWEFSPPLYNYNLSQALTTVSAWGIAEEEEFTRIPEGEIRLSLIGYPYSGKSTQANLIKEKYGVTVIEMEDIVQNCINSDTYQGNLIQEEDIVNEVQKKIAGLNRWVLVDFPSTFSLSKLFEEQVSGFKHKSEKPDTLHTQRIKKLMKICPNQGEFKDKNEKYKSALQHVIWIDCDKEECLNRSITDQNHLKTNTLPFTMVNLDSQFTHLQNWLSDFDNVLIKIDGSLNKDKLNQKINEVIEYNLEEIKKNQKTDEIDRALEFENYKKSRTEMILMLDEDEREKNIVEHFYYPIAPIQEKIEGLWELWESIQAPYEKMLNCIFSQERFQRTTFHSYLRDTQLGFIAMLYRPSSKQELLQRFQMEFNNLSGKFPDLREDPLTMAELHQQTEDLLNNLCDIIDARQSEAQGELDEITKSKWLECQVSLIATQTLGLLNAEYCRYAASAQVLMDYYYTTDLKKLPKTDPPKIELVLENIAPSDAIDKVCDKLSALPIYMPVSEEEKDTKNKKKDVKGKKAEEDKQEKSPYQELMEESLRNEHKILLQRVKRIQKWSKNRIVEYTTLTQKTFGQMQKWLLRASKAETSAALEIIKIIRSHIESQSRIRPSLELIDFDAIVNHSIRTYEEEDVPPLPAKEERMENRFSIKMLRYLHNQLRFYPDIMPKDTLVNLFVTFKKRSHLISSAESFPDSWLSLGKGEIYRMVGLFEVLNTGQSNWKDLLNSIILINSLPVMDHNLPSCMSREEWMSTQMWFEHNEINEDEEFALPFDRVSYVKELLFKVNCEGDQLAMDWLKRVKPIKGFVAFK